MEVDSTAQIIQHNKTVERLLEYIEKSIEEAKDDAYTQPVAIGVSPAVYRILCDYYENQDLQTLFTYQIDIQERVHNAIGVYIISEELVNL